jgi:Putative bacterial sensory transduction regulator
MTRTEVIQPFIEKTLAEWLDATDIRRNDKGEYLFRHGSAEICVRVDEGPQTLVSIYSVILRKVKKSARLLDALNTINGEIDFARVFWLENAVVLVTELLASTLEAEQVRTACQLVSRLADGLDTQLKKKFGGKTAFADERIRSDEVDV